MTPEPFDNNNDNNDSNDNNNNNDESVYIPTATGKFTSSGLSRISTLA